MENVLIMLLNLIKWVNFQTSTQLFTSLIRIGFGNNAIPKSLGLAVMPGPCAFSWKYRNSFIIVLETNLFCIFIFVFLTK